MAVNQELVRKLKGYFDLNIYETKVWLALLSKGISSAGEIAEISGVPRSRTYDVLESLEKRGFVIQKLGKPVKYIAVRPEVVIEKLKNNTVRDAEDKIKTLANLKDTTEYKELEELHKTGIEPIKNHELSTSIKGRSNLYVQMRDVMENAEKSIYITSSAYELLSKQKMFKDAFAKLVRRKVDVKVMVSDNEDEAKKLSKKLQIPLIPVNHLEAHIYSLFLIKDPPALPFIALVVSGGHTNIYYVASKDSFELMGQTRDDAAGEAFDKVAKLLGLGYPGGPVIEKLAATSDPSFISFPRSLLEKDSFDFSFSGLKSAVARYVHNKGDLSDDEKASVAASFQDAVIDVLSTKLINAAKFKKCGRIAVSGGVSANKTFVSSLKQRAASDNIKVFSPLVELCGDNALMVAARGYAMIRQGMRSSFEDDVYSRIKPE